MCGSRGADLYHLFRTHSGYIYLTFNYLMCTTTNMPTDGLILLRVSVGIVFLWFGPLKFFPGLSPAQDLAMRTTDILTFGLIPSKASLVILAAWETIIEKVKRQELGKWEGDAVSVVRHS